MKRLILLLLILFLGYKALPQFVSSVSISPDLELIRLTSNSWLHVSWSSMPDYGRFSSNGLIFTDNNNAYLFDTPVTDSLTEVLVTYLREKMDLNIVGFIPNHWHNDCMGGVGYLKRRGIPTFANQSTIDIAVKRNLPSPETGFSDSIELQLGDKKILAWFPGAAHSIDNIVIWIPSGSILFAGCMCKSASSQNLGNTADGDLESYPSTIRKVINRFPSAKIVIPGHGSPGGIELLTHTLKLATGN